MITKKFAIIDIKTIHLKDRLFESSFPDYAFEQITETEDEDHYPPVLLEKIEKSSENPYDYRIIEGFNRILYFQTRKKTLVEAFIYQGLSAISLFRKAIFHTLLFRDLNLIEKSIILNKLLTDFNIPENEIVQAYLPIIKEQPGRKLFNSILQLNHLTSDIKKYIVQERLTLSLAQKFCPFSIREQEIIQHFIRHLKLGVNKVKFLLETLVHISKRDNIAVIEVLDLLKPISSIFSISESSPALQKQLTDELLRLRFPRYQQQLNEIQTVIKRFKLPPKWKIIPPKNLEGEGVEIHLYIKNKEEYCLALKKLESVLENKDIDELFNLL